MAEKQQLLAPQQTMKLTALLRSGIDQLDLCVSDSAVTQLVSYLLLLRKWNATYNLSGISNVEDMLPLHVLDSLSISPLLNANSGDHILDIGSGAGLPGIPLAIVNPDKRFTLLDSNGKKTRFLFQAKLDLKLSNINIENCRIEHYQSDSQIDIVTCRAFASLSNIVSLITNLPKSPAFRVLAMKGNYPEQEILDLPETVDIKTSTSLSVPGIEGQRHLLELVFSTGRDLSVES